MKAPPQKKPAAAPLTPAPGPVSLSRQAAAHRCRLWFIPKVELLLMNDVRHYYAESPLRSDFSFK